MIKDFKMFEGGNGVSVITSYIVGLPSGEVIDISADDFVELKKERVVRYDRDRHFFTFMDENYKTIRKILGHMGANDAPKMDLIHDFMDSIYISRYKICEDMSVDVDDDVHISYKELTKIPVKFGKVSGDFDCSLNKLVNLVNSPIYVGGFFDCSINNIFTLISGPQFVKGGYYCSDNNLENLHGFPDKCDVTFDCTRNKIITLTGCPERISARFFNCSYNKLKNLINGPKVTNNFDCSHNEISTLSNGVREVRGNFDCTYNKLTDIMGMPSCSSIKFREGNKIEDIDYD